MSSIVKDVANGVKKIALIGMGIGFGVAMFILTRDKDKDAQGEGEKALVKRQPIPLAKKEKKPVAIEPKQEKPKAIARTEEKPAAAPAESLFVTLKAKPAKFVRGKSASLIATTLPGAECTLDAKYSTNRRPTGVDFGPHVAGHDGVVEWTWDIGTSGSHVDVKVTASLNGEDASAEKQVKIAD